MKMNKTLSSGRDQRGPGTFDNLVKGDAEQVIPDGLQFGMSGGNIDGRSVVTAGPRGERLQGGERPMPTSKPVTRGIKHV